MPPKQSFRANRETASVHDRIIAPIANRVTTSSQNPAYTIIVALLMANLLLISAIAVFFGTRVTNDRSAIEGAYLQAQIQQIKTSIVKLSRGEAAKSVANADVQIYTDWDLTLTAPKGFSIVQYDDELTEGQKNLRLTSRPGKLFLTAGGPATPKATDFTSGYQMVIEEIDSVSDVVGDADLVKTTNPLVQKIDFICDGAGCPDAKYLITSGAKSYLVAVNFVDYANSAQTTQDIISSIAE